MAQVERALNMPLNGNEVKEIILAKIRETLDRDGRLNEYLAFPAFRFTADIAIVLAGAIHSEVARTVTGGEGDVEAQTGKPNVHAVSHTEGQEQPPDIARRDAGLGVPVLSRDEKGRQVERLVKYAKEESSGATDPQ